jgi:hypothetical protein
MTPAVISAERAQNLFPVQPRSPLGQAEDALADDVVLNLVGARRDGAAARAQQPVRPAALVDRLRRPMFELALGPERLHSEQLDPQVQLGSAEFDDRTLGSRWQPS